MRVWRWRGRARAMQKRLRLRHRADFQRLRDQGQTWGHPLVVLSAMPNALGHNRYGIVTPRRLGGAVQRNRIRRRLREAIRHWHPQAASSYDLVFIARQGIIHCSYADLLDAVRSVLRQAGLFNT